MSYSSLHDFITALDNAGELHRIKTFVDPVLEITEVTDRVTKSGGKALLFENTGTRFPLLINTFGSDKRMAMAIGRTSLESAGNEIEDLFRLFSSGGKTFSGKLAKIPGLAKLAGYLPMRTRGKGKCQQVIYTNPDLSILPVLKCWPHDGGPFITLPLVHTFHPVTRMTNVGMYRMQILGKNTTGMHWQRHKTGAAHFEAWKGTGKRMPVSVTLGGDPVLTYCATAPLPENISEHILAGFLRKKRVKLVKCLTNDIYVPASSDIVIEGYVDPSEKMVTEGPFGDHTGFYSLEDEYPVFHVTCITHSVNAVYPATIVGIPPQEDAWLAKATEQIFLVPARLTLQPEIVDWHMPSAGVAHNLVVVKIKKAYPGQGMKVISSLLGAGQMMLSKYIIAVSGFVDIRNYQALLYHVLENTDPLNDIAFSRGPLDVLDHAPDRFSVGGKAGIDATVKLPEENLAAVVTADVAAKQPGSDDLIWLSSPLINGYNAVYNDTGGGILIISVNRINDPDVVKKAAELISTNDRRTVFRFVIAVDHTVDIDDLYMVGWQLLANSDPERDHLFLGISSVLIDGTVKLFRMGGFPRAWPNIVCSGNPTIEKVDRIWNDLGFKNFIPSPSARYSRLLRSGESRIVI